MLLYFSLQGLSTEIHQSSTDVTVESIKKFDEWLIPVVVIGVVAIILLLVTYHWMLCFVRYDLTPRYYKMKPRGDVKLPEASSV
ncbi:hypothetical protein ACF0H5_011966 [Mactra antiquata]